MGTNSGERRRMKQSKRRKQQRQRAGWQEANPGARGLRDTAGADEMADDPEVPGSRQAAQRFRGHTFSGSLFRGYLGRPIH
jgi:hypothetical protein